MTMKPTIGHKVWYWHGDPSMSGPFRRFGADQPFDATIIYVWSDTHVNLKVTDHDGNEHTIKSVRLGEPSLGDQHGIGQGHNHATWMPYQMGQAKQGDRSRDIVLQRIDTLQSQLDCDKLVGLTVGFNDVDEPADGEIVDAEITSGGGGDFGGAGADGSFAEEADIFGMGGEPSDSSDASTSGDTASDGSPSSSN